MNRAFSRIFKADHDKALAIDPSALLVYVALCRIHSDAKPEEKASFRAGAGRIARHCGLGRRTIQRWLPQLKKEGLIEIVSGRRKDRESDHEENRITLKGSATGALRSVTESGIKGARKKKLSQEREKENKRQSAESAGAGAPASSAGAKDSTTGWDINDL